jgi:glutaredoxin 3
MSNITVYTTNFCGYCTRAKALLQKKGAAFTEINVFDNDAEREMLAAKTGGRRTLPQIFIGQTYVGGCDDLYALDAKGGLDPLLAAQ